MEKKIYTYTQALQKAQKYCAYQERCQEEVRESLSGLGLEEEIIENVIAELVNQNFLNEERFSCAYARGKFKNNEWGWIKIENELRQRKISSYCIAKAKKEIDPVLYRETISKLALKKLREVKGESLYNQKGKVFRYIAGKGFESDLVLQIIEGIVK
ncbi:MAG: regulatory protein RecX [Bacteroidetes bacterium]|nr:regulatory protein RecX [Bacteroidota bacterium]